MQLSPMLSTFGEEKSPLSLVNREVESFDSVLEKHQLTYAVREHRIEVGKVIFGQWIFDVSVIPTEFIQLLEKLIPVFKKYGLPFSIPVNSKALQLHYTTEFGYEELGRIITIFPGPSEDVSE